jgi:hypothetical protein
MLRSRSANIRKARSRKTSIEVAATRRRLDKDAARQDYLRETISSPPHAKRLAATNVPGASL